MNGSPYLRRTGGLLLAALLAAGCGAPDAAPTTAPSTPSAVAPTAYPAPAAAPTVYPAPAELPTPSSGPYPEPTQSGAAGDRAMALAPAVGAIQNTVILDSTPVTRASVVATYPHDQQAYTQGLVYIGDDTLYEGTGWYADSSLREVALATGAVSRQVKLIDLLPPAPGATPAFGEGIAVVGERIFQLTWQSGVGIIYDRGFQQVGQFTYPPPGQALPAEGWGLTFDEASGRLIMSDGTANLYFVDPDATARTGVLAIVGQVEVRDSSGAPVRLLNELELVNGEVLANIYPGDPARNPDWIARIDPATGLVRGFIDLSGLRPLLEAAPGLRAPEVLNGIAYDAAKDRLLVTGKYWPALFEIDLPVARAFLPFAAIVRPAGLPTLWS